MRPVLGAQNPRIAELRRLIGRRSSRSDHVVIEGPRTVSEVLDAGHVPAVIVIPEHAVDESAVIAVERRLPRDTDVMVVRDHVFERLAPSASPQPMLAVLPRPASALPPSPQLVLVLVEVGDPGNVGTLVRAADAVAADAVVVVGGADPWGPKAVRSSAGSMLRVPVVQIDDLGDVLDVLRERGVRTVGTDVVAGEPFDAGVLSGPVAIILGSEPRGLGRDAAVDSWTHIAMPGNTESLNVAMAGTLLLFEASRAG